MITSSYAPAHIGNSCLSPERPGQLRLDSLQGGKTYQVRLWETEGLPFSEDLQQPVRVIWSQETVTENQYQRGKVQPQSSEHEELWLTTLDRRVFSGAPSAV